MYRNWWESILRFSTLWEPILESHTTQTFNMFRLSALEWETVQIQHKEPKLKTSVIWDKPVVLGVKLYINDKKATVQVQGKLFDVSCAERKHSPIREIT